MYSTFLYSTIHKSCYTILCCTLLYHTLLYCTVLCHGLLYSATLHCYIWYCTIVYDISTTGGLVPMSLITSALHTLSSSCKAVVAQRGEFGTCRCQATVIFDCCQSSVLPLLRPSDHVGQGVAPGPGQKPQADTCGVHGCESHANA